MGQGTFDYILVIPRGTLDHPRIKGQEALIIKPPTMFCNLVLLLPVYSTYYTTGTG